MLTDPLNQNLILILGLTTGLCAMVLRRASVSNPNPNDIAARGGLDHMHIGVLAGLALASLIISSVFLVGILMIAPTVLVAFTVIKRPPSANWLIPLYRLQMPLAILALICALIIWISVISMI